MVSTRLSPFKRQGQDIKKCKPNENILEFWRKNPIFDQNIEFSIEIRHISDWNFQWNFRSKIQQDNKKLEIWKIDWMKFDKCHLNLKILLGWRSLSRSNVFSKYLLLNQFYFERWVPRIKKNAKKKKSLSPRFVARFNLKSRFRQKKSKNMTRENP